MMVKVAVQAELNGPTETVEGSPPSAPSLRRRRRSADRCVSERRIAANRRNALRSTGPRTAAPKAAVRLNALRHGLDAAPRVLMPGEGPAERAARAAAYLADLRPGTREEEELVARMADASWLVRRAEAAAYAAAAEAIATHGPGTNVLVLECEAGGRGPFLRAERWNLPRHIDPRRDRSGATVRMHRQARVARRGPNDPGRRRAPPAAWA